MTLQEFKKWLHEQMELLNKGMKSEFKDVREKSFVALSTYATVQSKIDEVNETDD